MFRRLANRTAYEPLEANRRDTAGERVLASYSAMRDSWYWLKELSESAHASTEWDLWVFEHTGWTANDSMALHDGNGDLYSGVWQTISKFRFVRWWLNLKEELPPDDFRCAMQEMWEMARKRVDGVGVSADYPEPSQIPELLLPRACKK